MEIWHTEKNYNINNVTGKHFQLRNVRDRSFWLKPPVTYLLLSIKKMLPPKVPQSLLGIPRIAINDICETTTPQTKI